MDVAVSHSPSPPRPLPPSAAQATASAVSHDRAALERLVLEQLFNAPRSLGPSIRSGSRPIETMARLYSRLVTQRDFQTVDEDLQALIDALRESSRHGAMRAAYSLDNCSLGKVLHILCQVWRERSTLTLDAGLLVEAATLCGDLIERRQHFKLETCGVIMFHLGELITCSPLQPMCERLICDHLEPRFRAELRGQLHLPLKGPEALFGLISALRAAEGRVGIGPDGVSPRTAADKLLITVHMLLLRQPGILGRCESATLALLARHAAHYLHRLTLLPADHRTTPLAGERERTVATLLRRCIEEVSAPAPRQIDVASGRSAPAAGGHLRHALSLYSDWLAGQPRPIQARFALPAAAPGDRLSQFVQAVSALPEAANGLSPARDRALDAALDAAHALIVSLQLGGTRPPLATRGHLLLHMDTLYRHLEAANPINSQPYGASLAVLREFMSTQLAELVDAAGAPLLGPSPPLQTGLHSWQRLLLSQLQEQPASRAGV